MLYPGSNVRRGHFFFIPAFSPSMKQNQISDSLKYFGIKSTTTTLALVRISSEDEADDEHSVMEEMQRVVVGGTVRSLDALGALPVREAGAGGTDVKGLKKVRTFREGKQRNSS